MFSKRAGWNNKKNRLSLLLEEKRCAMQQVFDLTESNPTRARLIYPRGKILASLSKPQSLVYKPHPRGLEAARQAVADYYYEQGFAVDPDRLVLTCSTSEAYAHLFRLLGDPGDHFLVPHPSYPLYEFLAGVESVQLRPYHLLYDGMWGIDFHSIEMSITSTTRALLLVNPNNPTGAFVKRRELDRLREICTKHRLALVVDEVFSDYVLNEGPDTLRSLAPEEEVLTFILNGLSKISGLPQMKLGWILVSGPRHLQARALEQLEVIADTFLSVSTPIQHAAADLLEVRREIQPLILERLHANLEFLCRELEGTPARALNVEGGWYAVVQMPRTRTEEEWTVGLLENQNILLHPGYFFDFPSEAFVVCSLLTPRQVFQEGVQRFKTFLLS